SRGSLGAARNAFGNPDAAGQRKRRRGNMRTVICGFAVLAAIALAGPASAAAWKPGAPAWASEQWAGSLLRHQVADFASCRGIERYGHRYVRGDGDEYVRFDCQLENYGKTCHVQYKSVNDAQYGTATLRGYFAYACDPGWRGSGR